MTDRIWRCIDLGATPARAALVPRSRGRSVRCGLAGAVRWKAAEAPSVLHIARLAQAAAGSGCCSTA